MSARDLILKGNGPFKVAEVAAAIRSSPRYVQKLIDAGALPAGRVGRDYRIPEEPARALVRTANEPEKP